MLSAQWLFVNELVGEIPAFYIHILIRVSSVAHPGLLRVSSGSRPGLIRGIPWLIRVFRASSGVFPWLIRGLPCLVRGIPCLVLGYSVTRPGSTGSPGVVRELSGSRPWLVRVHFTIQPQFHDPGLSSVTNPWLFRVLSRGVPGKCSFHPDYPADTLRGVPGPDPGKWDWGFTFSPCFW